MARDLHPTTRSAVGSVRLEGLTPSRAAVELADQVARGELTGDEAVAKVLEHHGLVVPAQ
ncbi:MAG TPA: antitoxin VbhA family protein [Ilumatobacter sp.]|nr:antitoxin VbhA family protein [Ilumatobacter sp.]